MDKMIPAVLRVPYAGKPDLFPGIPAIAIHHIPVCDDPLLLQSGLHILRLYKGKELLQVFFPDILSGISRYGCQVLETLAHLEAVLHVLMRLIAHTFVLIQIKIIDAPVV